MERANRFTVCIDDSTGGYQFLVSDISSALLDETSAVNRASFVEPVNSVTRKAFYLIRKLFGESGRMGNLTRRFPGTWRINLAPIDGPILPDMYPVRSEAIAAEVNYLERNFLMRQAQWE